ncbi:MAG: TIGR04211 family SH3 domain-containing protein [Methylococcales bacterium]|nr:TIGR04211 family SH3 domain-containing protein [Methylococcales bacterium]
MKNILFPLLVLLYLSITSAYARTGYVTDSTKYALRAEENSKSSIVTMLPTGLKIQVLKSNRDTGYSSVKTEKGTRGYFLTRLITDKPTDKWYLDKANDIVKTLQQENEALNKRLEELSNGYGKVVHIEQQASFERDALTQKLINVRATAADALGIQKQRDQLQERVIFLERELQQVKRKNQALEDNTKQNWFLYGGMLSLFGVVIGVLLPMLNLRRKPTSSWDTF